jgi:hypothetical protein
MQLLVALAVCLSVLYAHPVQREWLQWKAEQSRQYDSVVEEEARRAAWLINYDYVNSNNLAFKLSLNQFADMVS